MRVTLDWDDHEAFAEHLDDARAAFEDKPWELRESSSGEGWHFIGYDGANDTRQGFENMMNLRDLWGDDPKRLKLDRKRWNAGSPFMQVLYRRKYMTRRDYPAEDGTGYSTGNVANVLEQNDAVKAAPERERVKDDDTGRLDYRRMLELVREATGLTQSEVAAKTQLDTYAAEDGGISRSTVSAYERGERAVSADSLKRWLRRTARSRGIGHYAETPDGGQAAEDVRYIDDGDQRRTLVEYIDVPWDWDIGGEDREYALLNTHTGSYNDSHTDRQLHAIHDDVTNHVMDRLSPSKDGKTLNLDAQNTHFEAADHAGWTREYDSINYEKEYLDPGEAEVYTDNLPDRQDAAYNTLEQPLFEIILWDEDMTDLIWHVLGVWTGSSVSDAVVLKDNKGWW
jgi:transcriptional regulator with XRE-family HTH domain